MNSCILIMSSRFLFRWATASTSRNRGRNCQDDGSSGRVGFSDWKVGAANNGKELTQQERFV